MTAQPALTNPSGKWILAGLFLIALIIFAFEWHWHHGTHKLEFKVCLNDGRGLAEGAPVELDGARIGFVRRMSAGAAGCPAQAEIYLNSLEQVLIPDDSHATLGQSAEGEVEVMIHPGQSRKPVGVGGVLKPSY
jgi:ABC-type transporter Mla subunit MlaD